MTKNGFNSEILCTVEMNLQTYGMGGQVMIYFLHPVLYVV